MTKARSGDEMNAPNPVQRSDGTLISDAHRIAWYFLKGTGQVRDDYADQVLLSQIIIGLAARGVTHRIRVANNAIAEFARQAAMQPRLVNRERA